MMHAPLDIPTNGLGTAMKVYIGGNDQSVASSIRDHLRRKKFECTASWIDAGEFRQPKSPTVRARIAVKCLHEIEQADATVFVDPHTLVPGGVHVEVGYALGLGKRVVLLQQEGRRSNTMMYHPRILTAFNQKQIEDQLFRNLPRQASTHCNEHSTSSSVAGIDVC